jgi:hypothetical protein
MAVKRILWLFAFLTLTLVGCVDASPEQIVFSLSPGVDTVEIASSHEDAGAKATVFGLKLKVIVVENTVDVQQVGMYRIVYQTTYRDVVKQIVRFIFVVDQTPPSGVLRPGIDTVFVGQPWMDASVDVTDNAPGTVEIRVEGIVNVEVPGIYRITYGLTDIAGNTATMERYVTVLDDPNILSKND